MPGAVTFSGSGTIGSGYAAETLSGGRTYAGQETAGAAALAVSPVVSDFSIISEIGRGGMGVLHRARQASLDREVALKAILPEQSSESTRWKFIAEALVTGSPPHAGPTLLSVLLSASRSEPVKYDPDVPEALQAVCRKAVSREPAGRCAGVAEFQADLLKYLKHRESVAICEKADSELAELSATGGSAKEGDNERAVNPGLRAFFRGCSCPRRVDLNPPTAFR